MANLPVVRPLGKLESMYAGRHAINIYNSVSTTTRYIIPHPTTEDWKTNLTNALANLVLAEPFLRVAIADEDSTHPAYVAVPALDVSQHLQFRTLSRTTTDPDPGSDTAYEDALRGAIIDIVDKRWGDDIRIPPWSVTIFTPQFTNNDPTFLDLSFTAHHGIGDGLSSKLFHTRLLTLLNDPSLPKVNPNLDLSKPTKTLPPPQESLISFPLSWPFFLATLWNEFAPSFLKSKPPFEPWHAANYSVTDTPKLRQATVDIPAAHTQRLVNACREKGVTLTPLIDALLLVSFTQRISNAVAFHTENPISLRPFVKSEGTTYDVQQDFHILVTSKEFNIPPETVSSIRNALASKKQSQDTHIQTQLESEIWNQAKKNRTETLSKLASLPKDDIMGLLQWVSDWREWYRKKDGHARETAWSTSNVGILSSPTPTDPTVETKWRATRIIFSQGPSVMGPGVFVNLASVQHGFLSITLNWQDGVIENELGEGITEDLGAWIMAFGESGRFVI